MAKTITYLYPEEELASKLKIYQEKSSQLRAFMFTRSTVPNIKKLNYSNNYAIYVLLSNDKYKGLPSLYIGQSENGISRIENHVINKQFWSHGFMFVTENNSFDKMTIDYLEWKFIKIFKVSSFLLENKDLRTKMPNISIYDQPGMDSYVNQILFLLSIEGISAKIEKRDPKHVTFRPKSKSYSDIDTLIIIDGKYYLAEGSSVRRVEKNYNKNITNRIDLLRANDKIVLKNGQLVAKQDILCKSPSGVAELITGAPTNGWAFFKDLEALRNKE